MQERQPVGDIIEATESHQQEEFIPNSAHHKVESTLLAEMEEEDRGEEGALVEITTQQPAQEAELSQELVQARMQPG